MKAPRRNNRTANAAKKRPVHLPTKSHVAKSDILRTTQLADEYLSEREASPHYRWFLKRIARQLESAGIEQPYQFDASSVNRWLSGLHDLGPTTRANFRRGALVLWHYAARRELVAYPSDRVMKVKPQQKIPVAWSMDELNGLLAHCRKLDGVFKVSQCPRSLFFSAFVLAGYELGIRRTDLHELRADQVKGNRVFIVQNKTGVPVGKIVSPECASLLRQMIEIGDGKTVFRWALGVKWLGKHFQKVVKGAGTGGTIKFLRRSGATHCEIEQPGSAGRFLGQLTPGLAQRFYVDPTLLAETQPRPPSITGTDSRTAAVAGSAASPHGHPSPFPGTGHREGVPLGKRTA